MIQIKEPAHLDQKQGPSAQTDEVTHLKQERNRDRWVRSAGITMSYSFSWAIHEDSCSDTVIYVVSIQAVFALRVCVRVDWNSLL